MAVTSDDDDSHDPGSGQSATQPRTVTRYTDIDCPRQVWVETPRFPVSVRLTRKMVAQSAAKVKMSVRTDLPVTITLDAPGFDIQGPSAQELDILKRADTEWVTFMLTPQAVGPGAVILEFRQAGNLAGTAVIPITISADPVQAIPALAHALPLHIETHAPVPDRTLVIGSGWKDGRNQFTFRLYEGALLRETFPPRPLEISVESYVADLYAQLTHHAGQAAGHLTEIEQAEAERLIRQIGRKLWKSVLPSQLRALYLAEWQSWQDGDFLIVSDDPNLPWELIWPYARDWDGPDEPWCLTMRLARWLRRTENGEGVPGPTARLRWKRFSTLVPDDTMLPFAQQERSILHQVIQNQGMDDCSPAHFALADVLGLFTGGGYDWLHAATHGSFRGGDPGRRSTLSLSDRETLSPDDLLDPEIEDHLWESRPGIVFNTCDSGRQGWGLTGAGGWASQFIGSGASVFLAAQWSVTDKQALKFATQFYKSLGDGESVAQAVRTARRAARADGDPTWLAYSLYAHPSAVVG